MVWYNTRGAEDREDDRGGGGGARIRLTLVMRIFGGNADADDDDDDDADDDDGGGGLLINEEDEDLTTLGPTILVVPWLMTLVAFCISSFMSFRHLMLFCASALMTRVVVRVLRMLWLSRSSGFTGLGFCFAAASRIMPWIMIRLSSFGLL
jgi:hypothetical protein